jgi:hypothetical protein
MTTPEFPPETTLTPALKRAQRKYEASKKGRDRAQSYDQSEKGRARKRKYAREMSPEQKEKQRESHRRSSRTCRERKLKQKLFFIALLFFLCRK